MKPESESAGRVGRYELIRRLAAGGMAEIFLARQPGIEGFEKVVVLKRILPQYAQNPEFVAMFLDEARMAATLHHPNIAQVYDIGRDGDDYYFAMEFVHGEDVRNVCKLLHRFERKLEIGQAIAIVAGAAAGLHAAHDKTDSDGQPLGIVHRDVSPSNVLVSFDGCVKVVDFGVAHAAQNRQLSRSGVIKGKLSYLSPEQARGEHVDRRSDVFALGTLLYVLTTGQRPFRSDSDLEILQGVSHARFESPSAACGGVYPFALESIVLKAMSKDPDDRYQTAQQMQLDLEAFARANELRTSPIELGVFMRELFSEKLKLWRLMRHEDSSRRRAPTSDSQSIEVATPGGSPRVETWMFEDVGSTDESDFECDVVIDEAPAPRRRGPVFAALAAASVVLAVLIATLSSSSSPTSESTAAAPEVDERATTRRTPPAPAAITVPIPVVVHKPAVDPEPQPEIEPDDADAPVPTAADHAADVAVEVRKPRRRARKKTWNRNSALPP